MNIRRLAMLFFHEINNYFKSAIMITLLMIPILCAVLANIYLPTSQEKTYVFAVNRSADPRLVSSLKNYGRVEIYHGSDEINARVLSDDDAIGIDIDTAPYIILQGDEPAYLETYAKLILSAENPDLNRSAVSLTYAGLLSSPLKYELTAAIIMLSVAILGIMMGFSILRERLNSTIETVLTSPVTKKEFYLSKGLLPIIFSSIYLYLILLILNIKDVDFLMLFILTFSLSFSSLIIGTIIGFFLTSQFIAVNYTFLVLFLVFGSSLSILFTPEKYHGFLYWSPFYWSFLGIYTILKDKIIWYQLIKYAGICFILNIGYIMILKEKASKDFFKP